MPRLEWDKVSERFYETGNDHGVLYLQDTTGAYPLGVAWNGLVSVSESPSGAESNPQYADNIKYLELKGAEEFGATIEAFTYPDEWMECDGSAEPVEGVVVGQQVRKPFGFVYRSRIGNDTQGDDLGYKLHLIYNALASPSEKAYTTVNDSPEPLTFSWEITTTPIAVTGHRPTAAITIDSTKADASKLASLEDILFGSDSSEPKLPTPDEVITMMSA